MILQELSQQIYADNLAKGYDIQCRSLSRLLILSEISEALEAIRKDKISDIKEYQRLKKVEFDRLLFDLYIKGSLIEELADILIRCLDYIARYNVEHDIAMGITIEQIYKDIIQSNLPNIEVLNFDLLTSYILHCISDVTDDDESLITRIIVIAPVVAYKYGITAEELVFVMNEKVEYNKTSTKLKQF